jgi:4-hydroxybenzoate polyprenyltransferase
MASSSESGASDIRADHWVFRIAPKGAWPYIRLARFDRPIGTWLLLNPCWWAIAMASSAAGEWPPLWMMAAVALGALVLRGAGCTINDLFDKDFDAKVARTATRPLPSGEITTVQALAFLGLLLAIGLVVLLQFNWLAVALGFGSVLLFVPYPLMKRITYWPQLWLGLTFNWGALLCWAAVAGELPLAAFLLYAGGICWTLGYDTIYAHQDKEDDIVVGVKSSALKLGDKTKPFLIAVFAGAVLLWAAAGAAAGLSWPFYLMLAPVALHFAWQVATLDTEAPFNCLARFKSNRDAGLLLLLAILTSQALR